jgi:hypothetical protein
MIRLTLCLPLCFVCFFVVDGHGNGGAEGASPILSDASDEGGKLPTNAEMERLARTDPVAFLENCLRRYNRTVKGYTCILQKQERIDGKLQRTEVIEAAFREEPFSVLMKWKQGARQADAMLYVKGENDDQMLVLPSGLFRFVGVVRRNPLGPEAKEASRYPVTEFGIKVGMQRTLASWQRARKQGILHVEFLGVKRVPEAGNRSCWVLRRTGYKKPEEDGITQLTIYVDCENWLQVGSILKGAEGQLIGEYFFRDIHLNPDFKPGTFTREGLTR